MKNTTELNETMRRATHDLAPQSPTLLIERARVLGGRRRLRRQAAVGVSATAVIGAVVTSALLATTGAGDADQAAPFAAPPSAVPAAPPAGTTYAPGSATEVPGGPQIPTDRSIVDDDTLVQVTRDLAPGGGAISLLVGHVTGSGTGRHLADTTTEGRAVSFIVDGAGARITIGRWDGYHAVGFGPGTDEQQIATTAREACGGSYRTSPVIECTAAPEGWYSVRRPNAGGASGAKELWVDLYTEDGYVVRVHSLNTVGEKQGSPVRSATAISEADSVTIARSPRWFTAG